jgi:hypothetical protein
MMPQRINERRLFGRRELTIHAWVQFGRRREACLIRNISEQGALVEFETTAPHANQMRLIVDFEDFEVDCDVRRRTENAIGLFFRPPKVALPAARGPNGNELARRVRSLWKHAQEN